MSISRLAAHATSWRGPSSLATPAERAVRTASSEQVRQPIYSGALDHWRHYEPWLDELKQSLGPVLDRYPIN